MAPLKAADALAALQTAGIDAHKAPAPAGVCRTCCYRVAGQPVNLGRLRQLAREVMVAPAFETTPAPLTGGPAVIAHLCSKFPVTTPATYQDAVDRLQDRGALITPGAVLREMERPALPPVIVAPEGGPLLPGETVAPATPRRQGPAPTLPPVGRLTRPPGATLRAPWDPGTDEARAAVALQGERAATLWPIYQAIRGAGLPLPGSWAPDGPVLNGERSYAAALASLSPDTLRAAAVALAALPLITLVQERALTLCRAALDNVAP